MPPSGPAGDRSAPVVEIRVGSAFSDEKDTTVVQRIGLVSSQPVYGTSDGQGLHEVHPVALARFAIEAAALTQQPSLGNPDDDHAWASLSIAERRAATDKASHVMDVIYGDQRGAAIQGRTPDPRYHSSLTREARLLAKAAELNKSRATLNRWVARFESRSLLGLVHGNRRPGTDPLDHFDPQQVSAARQIVSGMLGESVRSVTMAQAVFAERFAASDAPTLTRYRRNHLLDLAARGTSLFGDAGTRRTKANRRTNGQNRHRLMTVGQRLEMDTTRLNMTLWTPDRDGPDVVRCDVLIVTCVGSKYTVCRPALGAATGRDAMLLVHDIINPWRADVDDDETWARLLGLPDQLLLRPPGPMQFGTLVTDQGHEYVNKEFLGLLCQLGVDVRFASVYDPVGKPFIESMNRTFSRVQEVLPAYIGRSVSTRGPIPDRAHRLTFAEANACLQRMAWAVNNTPTEALPHPLAPNRFLSPNDKRNLDLANGAPLRLPATRNLIYNFLPMKQAVVHADGIHTNQARYWSPKIEEIWPRSAGDRRRRGVPITLHIDPYDMSRAYWHEPHSYVWHTFQAIGADNRVLPNFSAQLLAAAKTKDGRGLLSGSAREAIAAEFYRMGERALTDTMTRRTMAMDFMRALEAVPPPQDVPVQQPRILDEVGLATPQVQFLPEYDIGSYDVAEALQGRL